MLAVLPFTLRKTRRSYAPVSCVDSQRHETKYTLVQKAETLVFARGAFAAGIPMSAHLCHVPHCEVEVPPRLLMCKRHWFMVPWNLRRAVNLHFNPEQCIPGSGVKPTREWGQAARAAIESLVRRELQMNLWDEQGRG